MNTPINAYSYIRFSDPKQSRGTSQDRQTELRDKLIAKHGWQLDCTLTINDLGRSAFKGERKGLNAFLQAVEDGTITPGSVLIVEKLDRLSRDDIEAATDLFKRIVKGGILIATCEPERIYQKADLKNPFVWIELIMYFAVANEESQKKSDRLKDVWDRRRKANWKGGHSPAWITWDGDKPILDKAKAATERMIFDLTISGLGNRLLVKRLHKMGVATIGKSKVWTISYVRKILLNREVFGEVQWYKHDNGTPVKIGDPIPNFFPAVISEKTFYEAQTIMTERKIKRGKSAIFYINIFEVRIFDVDGSPMRIISSSNEDRARGIYRRLGNASCSAGTATFASWPYLQFQTRFLQALQLEFNTSRLTISKATRNRLPVLQAKLTEIDTKIQKLQTEMNVDGDFEAGLDLLRQLNQRRKDTEAEIDAEKISINSATRNEAGTKLESILSVMEKTKGEELKELEDRLKTLVAQTVDRVEVDIRNIDGNRLSRQLICTVQLRDGGSVWFRIQTYKGGIVSKGWSVRIGEACAITEQIEGRQRPLKISAKRLASLKEFRGDIGTGRQTLMVGGRILIQQLQQYR